MTRPFSCFTVCFSSLTILGTVVLTVCVSECFASLFSRYGKLGSALSFELWCLCHYFTVLNIFSMWCEPVYDNFEPLAICWVVVHERTIVSTGFLAQASMSRLGEINRGSSKLLHASGRSGNPCPFWASERLAQTRGVLPKRDPAWATVPLFEPSPKRDPSAWARSWARQCDDWLFIVLGWLVLAWVWLLWWKIYNELLCMSDMIHGWWMMGMVWTWHVN